MEEKPNRTVNRRLTRRRALQSGLSALAMGLGGFACDTLMLEVTRHRVPMRGLKRLCRVAQLTDLHRSWCVSEAFIAGAVDRTNALHPDLVLLTGDFVSSHSRYIESCARQLRRLRAPLGLYGVLGNHDYKCDFWQGSGRVEAGLTRVGVQMLTNCSVRLANGLRLVGVDDYDTGNPDLDAAFRETQPGEPMIAMTHNPLMFGEMCAYRCVTLAGHTHGGQVYVPGLTQLMMDERSRYLRGWFHEPEQPGRLYVSRGVGLMQVPIRFCSAPEIALFDLVPAA